MYLDDLKLPFLTTEHQLLRQSIRDFAKKEIMEGALERDEKNDIKETVRLFKKLRQLDVLGIRIPEKYGGVGADMYFELILMEELGYADASVALTTLIHTGAAAAVIYEMASEELKQKYLPKVATGEKILAFAMTESDVPGSWSSYMQTTARLDGDHYVLNGTKVFITNATIADLFVVFARTTPDEKGHKGIGIFLVEKEFPGVSTAEEPSFGDGAGSWGSIFFDNCQVPKENLVKDAPTAFAEAMQLFNYERMENPSICNGIAQRALDETISFLSQRKDPRKGFPFTKSYQHVQFKLAEMYARIRASRLMVWHACYLAENGHPFIKEVSSAKFYANETVRWVCEQALQLHGGYGFSRSFIVQKLLRDAFFGGIAGGTLEALKDRTARELLK